MIEINYILLLFYTTRADVSYLHYCILRDSFTDSHSDILHQPFYIAGKDPC